MDKEKSPYKKVGNSSFHVETIKSMKLKGFKETYSKVKAFEGKNLDALFTEITGIEVKDAKVG